MSDVVTGTPQRLETLTALRFFAALHVVLFHSLVGGLRSGEISFPMGLGSIIEHGYVAVSFFFVLSGYVLSYAYYAALQRGRDYAQPRPFWIARVARIYPTYLLGLLLALPYFLRDMWGGSVDTTWSGMLSVVLMTQSWIPKWAELWNGPAWSVAVEMFFYAVFPFIVTRLWRMPARRAAALAMMFWFAMMIFVSCIVIWRVPLPDAAIKFHPLVRLPEFVIGIVLARFQAVHALRSEQALMCFVVGAMTVAVIILFGDNIHYFLKHSGLMAPAFALFILGAANLDGVAACLLTWRPFIILGEASYALYILHIQVVMYWDSLNKFLGMSVWPVPGLYTVVKVGVCMAVALVVHLLYEGRARTWVFKRFLSDNVKA